MAKTQNMTPATSQVKPGRIIIVRHGRPNLNRNLGPRLTWREYRDWWAAYEGASLDEGQTPPTRLIDAAANAPFLFASIRPRAIETAQAIAGDREIVTDPIFIEAPLPPPRWSDARRFLPKTWNMIARVWWCFGYCDGDEHVDEARARAGRAAEKLIDTADAGRDVVLTAHGWFNRMMRPELKARGWACRHDGGDKYWSFRIYEKR